MGMNFQLSPFFFKSSSNYKCELTLVSFAPINWTVMPDLFGVTSPSITFSSSYEFMNTTCYTIATGFNVILPLTPIANI